tara:strand:+ start:198 stop:380 length:183 start_codon:yes stop_codon:yes gene_type:complete
MALKVDHLNQYCTYIQTKNLTIYVQHKEDEEPQDFISIWETKTKKNIFNLDHWKKKREEA